MYQVVILVLTYFSTRLFLINLISFKYIIDVDAVIDVYDAAYFHN